MAVFTVTNLNDSGDGSLRQAILDANAAEGADEIEFESAAVGTINLTSGELAITDTLIVNGPGPDVLTIDGNEQSRVFNIDDGSDSILDMEIGGLTITGGSDGVFSREKLLVTNSTISGNTGRGIRAEANVTVADSTISDNTGGGLSAYSLDDDVAVTVTNSTISGNTHNSHGGGIYARTLLGNRVAVRVTNSTISDNAADGRGGGIYAGSDKSGSVSVTDSIISGNTAGSDGGGVFVSAQGYRNGYGGVSVGVIRSTISGNSADRSGGGIHASSSFGGLSAWVSHSVIDGNTAGENGGGMFASAGESVRVTVTGSTFSVNTAEGTGGGIHSQTRRSINEVDLKVASSTISGNTAGRAGGGMYVSTGYVTVTNSTISGNRATVSGGGLSAHGIDRAEVMLADSILSGNTIAGGIPGDLEMSVDFFSVRNSLLGVAASARVTEGSNNITDDNPGLAPLADNGGPTETHALLRDSPAINAGDPNIGPRPGRYDQRGAPFARVVGGRMDIGAFEFGPPSADLTGDGFVDFQDLTVLLAAWNQNVSVTEGNLVNAADTPVNFADVSVLLAAWTGPGAAGAPVGRRLAAAVGGDSVGDVGESGEAVAVPDASYTTREVRRRRGKPAAYGSATGVASYRRGDKPLRRLQAAAVDRAMAEHTGPDREIIVRRWTRRGERR